MVSNCKPPDKIRFNNRRCITDAYEFAMDMSVRRKGEHVKADFGTKNRKDEDIFTDVFQGKLGEFAIYDYYTSRNVDMDYPDLTCMPINEYDKYDFKIGDNVISVKTTKSSGQLMMLEVNKWTTDGVFRHDGTQFDYFFLVRITGDISYTPTGVDKRSYYYDIVGYIDKLKLTDTITANGIINSGDGLCINKYSIPTRMKQTNYFVESTQLNDKDSFMNDIMAISLYK